MRGKIKAHLFIKVTVYLPFSFRKNLKNQDKASTEISYQFLAPKVLVLRRNKATYSSTSTDPFSAAMKTLVLVIYSSLLDLSSHSHAQVN